MLNNGNVVNPLAFSNNIESKTVISQSKVITKTRVQAPFKCKSVKCTVKYSSYLSQWASPGRAKNSMFYTFSRKKSIFLVCFFRQKVCFYYPY